MKTLSDISVCRRCQSYTPEGRRGGHCQQLNVAVQGNWTTCALAIPPFSPAWENFEDIMSWQQKTLVAMQVSTESAITEALSEVSQLGVTRSEGANSHENAALVGDSEPLERSSNVAIQSHAVHALPAAPVQTLGIKALWM